MSIPVQVQDKVVPLHRYTPVQVALITVLGVPMVIVLLIGGVLACKGSSLGNKVGRISEWVKREALVARYTSRLRGVLPNIRLSVMPRSAVSEGPADSTIEDGVEGPHEDVSRHM